MTDYLAESIRDEFADSLRLPLIATSHPGWCFITAVVVDDLYHSIRPTDDELRVVASFHDEYVEHWYRDSFKEEMRERPFDLDGGAVGRYLIKWADGDWGFRRSTWDRGPLFWPGQHRPVSLFEVLDKIHTTVDDVTPRWLQWKQDHADLFPQGVGS